jgi:intracellular sulfur oxidation DsrE/DsrF family protein
LQASGVIFCVCDMALTVNSYRIAGKMNIDGAELKKEFVAGILPAINLVPSGIWAIGRAQEHGCGYCFAS